MMGKLVTFVLGVFVGVAATLAFLPSADAPEPEAEAQPERAAEVRPAVEARKLPSRNAPQPIVASGPTPYRPEAPSSLEDALIAANGDVESLVVDGGMYVGGRVEQLLSGDEFAGLVGTLLRTASPQAAEHYQRIFDQYHQLPSVLSGNVRVDSLACGRRVCAVSLIGHDAASVDRVWTELTGAPVAMSPIMKSGTGLEISMGTGRFIGSKVVQGPYGPERRLLIAVDPSVNSATTGFNEFRPPGGG